MTFQFFEDGLIYLEERRAELEVKIKKIKRVTSVLGFVAWSLLVGLGMVVVIIYLT